MNSTVKKHSILLGRRLTSISLEDVFWTSLQQIARGRQVTRSELIASLNAARKNTNLSSAIRVFILDHYRAMAVVNPQRDHEPGFVRGELLARESVPPSI